MKNVGKIFEDKFKESVPDYCLLIRLPDPPQAFTQRKDTRFSHKNPFDYIMFDTNSRTLFCLELKSTKNKSISFENIDTDEEQKRMIHRHQILGLKRCSEYRNITAGFLFNFRDENNNMERTYFQSIEDFYSMVRKLDKFSFNEIDLILNNSIKIQGIKKRTRYIWDIDLFLKSQYDKLIER